MTKSTAKPKQPVFLVVVDDSEEMHQALQFACGRARSVGGRVALMYCIVLFLPTLNIGRVSVN